MGGGTGSYVGGELSTPVIPRLLTAARARLRLSCRRLALVLAACAALLAWRGFEIALVPTPSMEGAIVPGDHLLIDKLSYARWFGFLPPLRAVQRGDIVSFVEPGGRLVLVKRVIALGGDRVDIEGDKVRVNGQAVAIPYRVLLRARSPQRRALTVPAGSYFVLGDNRDLSEDSRAFGPVPAGSVIGEPVLICWSFARSWQAWLDEHGRVRSAAYFSVLRHPLESVRWERTGQWVR